jgi:dTDP-4-dehydrorhamnose reductase
VSRWLVTGAGGMLGRDLLAALDQVGEDAVGLTHRDLDVTVSPAVRAALREHRPDIVVNCAAWTVVDDAETHEDAALLVNGRGAEYVAAACAESGARLLHMSTDYVFGGTARRPYAEAEIAEPRTAYGRTKLAGEQAVLRRLPWSGYVVRTAWLYGAHGPNFARTMIRKAGEGATVDVVDDQRGQPTWTVDVARQVIALGRGQAKGGIFHATSSGETTWFGFAREIFRLLGADPERVRPTTSARYPRVAPRPGYSVLGHEAWASVGIEPIGDWRPALERAFPALSAVR